MIEKFIFDISNHNQNKKMENLIFTKKQISEFSVSEIDIAIESLDSYSQNYVATNQIEKLKKVLALQEILIDARCEKLGIIL